MADVTKIKLPDNSEYNLKDNRIPGVDTTPTSGSDNVVTSGGVYTAIENNELVIATALNDLNDRLSDVENITIPTKVSDLENDSGFTSNTGTLTGVKFNNVNATVSNGVASITATIPAAVTESTVSGWGFTKNTGTYSKPSDGIPASDLAAGVVSVILDGSTGILSSNISGITGIKQIDGYDGTIFALGSSNSDGNEDYVLATTDQIPTESTVSNWGFTKNTGTYSMPSGGIPATDLASAVQTSLGKADTALQSFTETDPTVPTWAKQSTKPTYTASEVGALPDTTIIPTVPTNVSAFTNDANYLKYVLCADEAAYNAITTKDSGTLYLIPE